LLYVKGVFTPLTTITVKANFAPYLQLYQKKTNDK
jgi:hypothetical protein